MNIKHFMLTNGSFIVNGKVKYVDSYALEEGNTIKIRHNIEIEDDKGNIENYFLKENLFDTKINNIKNGYYFLLIDKEKEVLKITKDFPMDDFSKELNILNASCKSFYTSAFFVILFSFLGMASTIFFKIDIININEFLIISLISISLLFGFFMSVFHYSEKEHKAIKERIKTYRKLTRWLKEDEPKKEEQKIIVEDILKV